jgi:hypothetical protein
MLPMDAIHEQFLHGREWFQAAIRPHCCDTISPIETTLFLVWVSVNGVFFTTCLKL